MRIRTTASSKIVHNPPSHCPLHWIHDTVLSTWHWLLEVSSYDITHLDTIHWIHDTVLGYASNGPGSQGHAHAHPFTCKESNNDNWNTKLNKTKTVIFICKKIVYRVNILLSSRECAAKFATSLSRGSASSYSGVHRGRRMRMRRSATLPPGRGGRKRFFNKI